MEKGLNAIFPLPLFIDRAEGSEYELRSEAEKAAKELKESTSLKV